MNRSRRQAGQSIVESALILTAFMGLLLGTAAIGESLFVRETLADRARIAARWGALNRYDPAAIRRVVLYGTASPASDQSPFLGLAPAAIDVSSPGCPGPECRLLVAIPEHGIRCVEPIGVTPRPVASQP